MKKRMTPKMIRSRYLKAAAALACIALTALPVVGQDEEEEEVFELSPFVVDTSQDSGYLASSTLAGTRLNTSLDDVGAAIQVVTQEFMDDVGATDYQAQDELPA